MYYQLKQMQEAGADDDQMDDDDMGSDYGDEAGQMEYGS